MGIFLWIQGQFFDCRKRVAGVVIALATLAIVDPCEARTIYVDQRQGDDSHEGVTPDQPLRTISRAAELTQGGDEVIVERGIYYEQPAFRNLNSSSERPVWIRAKEPGTVTISAMWQDAAEGRVRWRRHRGGVFSAPHEPPLFGHFDGTFLFRFNSIKDLKRGQAGSIVTPPYGFAAQDGMVYVKLPGGADPNGKSVKFSAKDTSVVRIRNSPNVVIDGFRIEGAGKGLCIAFDAESDHAIVRNTVMTSCRHGVRLADDGLIEWSEYSYPGFRDFAEAIRLENGSTTAVYQLVKEYHPKAWLEGGLAISFGRDHASKNGEFRYNYIHETFDGEQLGQFEYSSSHHNVYMYNYDNHVEFENWAGHGARELRLHDSLLLASPLGPLSHQDVSRNKGMVGPHYVYRNVVFGLDSHGWDSWTVIKSRVRNPDFAGLHYYHNLLWTDGRAPLDGGWGGRGYLFWDDKPRDRFTLRNNIIIFNEGNDNRERGRFDSDFNVYVNAADMPWLRGPNGAYLGADPSVLQFISIADLNFGLLPGSPAENAGTPLSGFNDNATGGVDAGPFQVGENPGNAWPRARKTVFTTSPPAF